MMAGIDRRAIVTFLLLCLVIGIDKADQLLLQCKVLQKRDFVTTFVGFIDAKIALLHNGRPLAFGALRKLKDLVDKGFADGGGNGAGERRIAQCSGIRFSKKGKNGSEYGDEDHCDGG